VPEEECAILRINDEGRCGEVAQSEEGEERKEWKDRKDKRARE
jgi:hypothetical protein